MSDNNEPKDKFDETDDRHRELIKLLEPLINGIKSDPNMRCLLICGNNNTENGDNRPLIYTLGPTFEILQMSAPIIKALKLDVMRQIDC